MGVIRQNKGMLIALAGNVGAGKTTTGKLLQATGRYTFFEERWQENPYFGNPETLLESQLWFARQASLDQAKGQQRALATGQSVILERCLDEHAQLFAKQHLTPHEFITYQESIQEYLRGPQPDLIVYLEAPLEVLRERIQDRLRTEPQREARERSWTIPGNTEFTKKHALYHQWVESLHARALPVVSLDTRLFDLNPTHTAVDHALEGVRFVHYVMRVLSD